MFRSHSFANKYTYNMNNNITLFCLMHGCPVDQAFPVTIDRNDTVYNLRDQIKKTNSLLTNVDISNIGLWKMYISADSLDKFDPYAAITTLEDSKKMHIVQRICNIFPTNEAADDYLHIIVQVPFVINVRTKKGSPVSVHPFIWITNIEEMTLQVLWRLISFHERVLQNKTQNKYIIRASISDSNGLYMTLKENEDLIKIVRKTWEPVAIALHIIEKDIDDDSDRE